MKALVLLSGGIDSATCLGLAVEKYGSDNVIALSVSYGQKHIREIEASENISARYGVEHISTDLANIFAYSDSSLLKSSDKAIPAGTYEEQQAADTGSPVDTYIPFRNGLFLSVAAAIALSKGAEIIWYGIHADDTIVEAYPDCSQEFNEYMDKAIYTGSGKKLHLHAPFVGKTKADVVAKGLELNVPYELTWSCYEGGDTPCGKCATCIDRAKAFEINGVADPAGYIGG